jgi:hypothetical protein
VHGDATGCRAVDGDVVAKTCVHSRYEAVRSVSRQQATEALEIMRDALLTSA